MLLSAGQSVSFVESANVSVQVGPSNMPGRALASILSSSLISNSATSTGILELEGIPGGNLVDSLAASGLPPGLVGIAAFNLTGSLTKYQLWVVSGGTNGTNPYPNFTFFLNPGQSLTIPSDLVPSNFVVQAGIAPEPGTLVLVGSCMLIFYMTLRRNRCSASSPESEA
jgi:hypothetical protein